MTNQVMQQALKALNDSVYLVSEYYNEAVDLYYNQPAQQINLAALNTDVAAHKAAIKALESAIAQPVEAPLTPIGWMLVPIEPTIQMLENSSIASDYEVSQSRAKVVYAAMLNAITQPAEPAERIHSCSYFCDKPACIKAQRRELSEQNAELILPLEKYKEKTPQVMPAKETVLDLAHRKAWRYKKSRDPALSATYEFDESCLIDFVRVIAEMAVARPLESKK